MNKKGSKERIIQPSDSEDFLKILYAQIQKNEKQLNNN